MQGSWSCPLCEFFAYRTLKGVVRHIGAVHSYEASFHITCGVSGCPRTYRSFFSYKKHMFLKHRDIMEVNEASETACELALGASESDESASQDDISEPPCFLVSACSCFVWQVAS